MEAKLKTFEPLMHEGTHQTWESPNGLLFKFTVEFENGEKGTAQSTKQQPTWKIGTEYIFEITDSNGYKNIKGMKTKDSNFSPGGGGKKEDPLKQQMIIAQSSMKLAVDIIQMGIKKEDGITPYVMKDLEPLTDGLIGIINRLANKHNN